MEKKCKHNVIHDIDGCSKRPVEFNLLFLYFIIIIVIITRSIFFFYFSFSIFRHFIQKNVSAVSTHGQCISIYKMNIHIVK